jgi:hypothetical protein
MPALKQHPELLTSWPPRPAQVFTAYGFQQADASTVRLVGILAEANCATVTFNGRHERGGCRYQLETASEEFAGALRAWLHHHVGRTLKEIGELEFDETVTAGQ